MSTFDISAYLNSKQDYTATGIPEVSRVPIPEMTGAIPVESPITKAANILEASRKKEYELKEQSLNKRALLAEQNQSSFINKLGLEYDSTAGSAINAAVGGFNTVRRWATEVAAMPASTRAEFLEKSIGPQALDILRRQEAGQTVTPEEEALISKPTASGYDSLTPSGPSAKELYGGYFGVEGSKRIAREFRKATDTSSLVNSEAIGIAKIEQEANAPLQKSLKSLEDSSIKDWKKEDVANVIKSVFETGGNNKLAIAQGIAENLPSIALGIISPGALVATNLAYAQTNYDKWEENFLTREKRQPTAEEKETAKVQSLSLAAAETAGDLLSAGATKSLKASLGFGSKAASATTPQALKSALGFAGNTAIGQIAVKAAPIINKAAQAVGKIGLAAGTEYGTEAYQTSTEELLETGKRASYADAHFGGTLGALSSGGITSAGAAIGLGKDILGTAKEVVETKKQENQVSTDAYKQAVSTGDVSGLLNSADPVSNKWVSATEALIEGATSDEKIKDAINKIDTDVVTKLQNSINDYAVYTEERASIFNKRIDEFKTLLEADPDSVAISENIAKLEQQRDKPISAKQEERAIKSINLLRKQLDVVTGLREGLKAQTVLGEASVVDDAKAITTTDTTTASKPAVDVPTFIARAMKVRGAKTQELADAINAVADSGKATPEEIKTLRILSAEIIASNKAKNSKDVSKDVYSGTGPKAGTTARPGLDFKGVFTYQKAFDEAFAKNDKDKASKEFDGLNNFVKHHGNKLDAYQQLKPGQMAVVDKQGNWLVEDISENFTNKSAIDYAKSNGGFAWVGNSATHVGLQNLIANIEEEISVMVPVLQKMSLELGKPINTPALKAEGNVSVKQTVKAKQTKKERQEVSRAATDARDSSRTSTPGITEEIPIDGSRVSKEFKDSLKDKTTDELGWIAEGFYADAAKLKGKLALQSRQTAMAQGEYAMALLRYLASRPKVLVSKPVQVKTPKPKPKPTATVARAEPASVVKREAVAVKPVEEVKPKEVSEKEKAEKVIKDAEIRRAEEEQRRLSEEAARNSANTTPTNVVGNQGQPEVPTRANQAEVAEEYAYSIELINGKLVIEDNSSDTKNTIIADGSLFQLIDDADEQLTGLGFEFQKVGADQGSPYISWVKFNPKYGTNYVHRVAYYFSNKASKTPWVFWDLTVPVTNNNNNNKGGKYPGKSAGTLDVALRQLNTNIKETPVSLKAAPEEVKPTEVREELYEITTEASAAIVNLMNVLQDKNPVTQQNSTSFSQIFQSMIVTVSGGINNTPLNIEVMDVRDFSVIPPPIHNFSSWRDLLGFAEEFVKKVNLPVQGAIRETQDELSSDKTTSTAEVAEKGTNQEVGNDPARDGTSSNTSSDESGEQEQVIKEDKKYTSKAEVLKAIKTKREALIDFVSCVGSGY